MNVFHSLIVAGYEASVVRREDRFRLISQADGRHPQG
jgi:hypothetical protein